MSRAGRPGTDDFPAVLHRLALVAVTAAVALAFPAGPRGPAARAQAEVAPEAVAAIARDLNCPLCQGYTLQDCPLEVCAQMRALIRQRLAAGESRAEIMAAFVDEYGPQVLNAPPRRGPYLLAWLLPLAVLAGCAVFVWRRARRAAGGTVTGAADASDRGAAEALTSPYAERLDRLARGEER
jgi:cytochrome c-type biogenesis protein CcmH